MKIGKTLIFTCSIALLFSAQHALANEIVVITIKNIYTKQQAENSAVPECRKWTRANNVNFVAADVDHTSLSGPKGLAHGNLAATINCVYLGPTVEQLVSRAAAKAKMESCKQSINAIYANALKAKVDFEKSCKTLDVLRQLSCLGVHMELFVDYHKFRSNKYFPDHTINLEQIHNADLDLIAKEGSDYDCREPTNLTLYSDIESYYKQHTVIQNSEPTSVAQSSNAVKIITPEIAQTKGPSPFVSHSPR